MRKLIILLLAVGWLLSAPAAESGATVKLRQFLNQRNVVLESREVELGSVTDKYHKKITFYTLVCSSLGAAPGAAQGVEVIMLRPPAKEGEDPTTISVYLDYDELGVFAEGIGAVVNAVDGWEDAKSLNTISLKSRDDFTVRVSKYPGAASCVVSVSGYDGDDLIFAVFETPQHLLPIKGFLEKALKTLPPPDAKP